MFKQIQYGIGLFALSLSFATMSHAGPGCVMPTNMTPTAAAAFACDFSFTAIPSFANMCLLTVQSGIYTVRNNTPVRVRINYIRIQDSDSLPEAAAAIVAAPTNNCVVGSLLAPGATCNIQVNLLPLTVGVFNRTLQVGVNTRQVELDAPTITALVNDCLPPEPPLIPAPFTADSQCTILGGATVTNTGLSAVNGNVCVSPGSAITGFPPGTIVNGSTFIGGTATADDSQADLTTGYNALAGLACGTVLTGQDLGTVGPLSPGVYCFASSAQLTGALVLNGAGTYVFQMGSTLTTASNSSVTLINGANRNNVFWQVGSSATLGTGTQFQGTIAAQASITLNAGVSLLGRALARTGAVTMDTNAVNPA